MLVQPLVVEVVVVLVVVFVSRHILGLLVGTALAGRTGIPPPRTTYPYYSRFSVTVNSTRGTDDLSVKRDPSVPRTRRTGWLAYSYVRVIRLL
jgi:hypothetical protein